MLFLCAILGCGEVTPPAEPPPAAPAMPEVRLLGRRALLDAPRRLLFDAGSPPLIRAAGSLPPGATARWGDVTLALRTPETREPYLMYPLAVPPEGLPPGDAALSVAGVTWAVRWDDPPDTRPGLKPIREQIRALAGPEAESALRAALPGLAPADRLWAQIDLARLRARTNPRQAEDAWVEAADAARPLAAPSEVSRRLRAAARFTLWDRRYDRALALLDESEAVDRAAGDADGPGTGLYRAQVADRRGLYAVADALLERAAEHARANALDLDWAAALQQRATMLGDVGQFDRARALMDEAAAWYAAHPGAPGGGADLDQNRGWLLLMLALSEGTPAAMAEARAYYEAAMARADRPGSEAHFADMAASLALLSLRAQPPDAIAAGRWLELARERAARSVDDLLPFLEVLEAERLLALGRHADADARLARVVAAQASEAVTGEILWRAHALRAQAALSMRRTRVAREAFSAALSGLEETAARTAVQSGRGHFLADRRVLFDAAIDFELAAGHPDAALQVAERAAAPVLRATAARTLTARLDADDRTAWETRLGALMAERDAFERDRRGDEVLPSSERAAWRRARETTAESLRQRFDEAFSWLAERTGAVESDLSAVLAALPSDHRVVLVHARRGARAARDVFVAGSSGITHRRLDELTADDLRPPGLARGHVFLVTGGDASLRDVLAGAVAGGLAGWPPELTLSLVPYAGLLGAREPSGGGAPVVVGDANGNLPHARAEARAIAERLPGARLTLGEQVTRASVLDLWGGPRVFHFAGHGLLAGESPWDASLRVAGDAALTLTDVLATRPHPGLAVLSGCETARALSVSRLEQVGLPEGFLLGGTRTVLASLQRIDDSETVRYMERFYARGGMDHPSATWLALLREDAGRPGAVSHAFLVFGRP